MTSALLVLDGRLRETLDVDASWRAHIHALVHDALPVQALHLTPIPLLTLFVERRRSHELQTLLHLLLTQDAASPNWQTFLAPDSRIGESFAVFSSPSLTHPVIRLRFEHRCHLPVLHMIAHTGQVAIAHDAGPIKLAWSIRDLQMQLDVMQATRTLSSPNGV